MAGKSVETLQSEYEAALAKEQDNPDDQKARKAAGTASRKLMEAREEMRRSRRGGADGVTVIADEEE